MIIINNLDLVLETTSSPGYHILGHIAERSHLENPSTECIVVQEVGHTKGDIRILVHPVAYRRLWSASSRYGLLFSIFPLNLIHLLTYTSY